MRVCCKIISLSQIAYGSVVWRQGKSRAFFLNHSNNVVANMSAKVHIISRKPKFTEKKSIFVECIFAFYHLFLIFAKN